MAKKNSKRINPFIRILVSAVLLFAVYQSISTISLALWGNIARGTVDTYSSRYDSRGADANRSRTIFKSYTFSSAGRTYRGYVTYLSDEAWPRLEEGETRSELIRYFAFLPYLNKPAELTDFDQMGAFGLIYHISAPVLAFMLLLVVNGWLTLGKQKRQRKAETVPKSASNWFRRDTYIAETGEDRDSSTRSDNTMYCRQCGQKIGTDSAFCTACGFRIEQDDISGCPSCGAEIPDGADFCIRCGADLSTMPTVAKQEKRPEPAVPHRQDDTANLVGFSQRYRSPEILAAGEKNRKSSIGCMWVLVFVPLLGFPLAGLLMDDFPFGESLVIGVGISLIMLVVSLLRLKAAKKPLWEGTVLDKYSKERSEQRGHSESNGRTYTEYTTVIRTDSGKKKTIVERDSMRHMHDYLKVGDRVRFHPMFGTYEKYDKSKDRIIYCNVCSMLNKISNDRCDRCDNPLFK